MIQLRLYENDDVEITTNHKQPRYFFNELAVMEEYLECNHPDLVVDWYEDCQLMVPIIEANINHRACSEFHNRNWRTFTLYTIAAGRVKVKRIEVLSKHEYYSTVLVNHELTCVEQLI